MKAQHMDDRKMIDVSVKFISFTGHVPPNFGSKWGYTLWSYAFWKHSDQGPWEPFDGPPEPGVSTE